MHLRPQRTLVLLACSTLAAASVAEARGCFVSIESESRTISVSAAGVQTEVAIWKYPDGTFDEDTPSCSATARVKLSSFPTSRLALRPREVAEAIRDVAAELGATECAVSVAYENDTDDELAEHELCAVEVFRYDGDAYWSSGPESDCWEATTEA